MNSGHWPCFMPRMRRVQTARGTGGLAAVHLEAAHVRDVEDAAAGAALDVLAGDAQTRFPVEQRHLPPGEGDQLPPCLMWEVVEGGLEHAAG